MSDGSYVDGFDAGTYIQDIAFDAAGNLVTTDNNIEWMRIWSPPDGANSFTTESYFTFDASRHSVYSYGQHEPSGQRNNDRRRRCLWWAAAHRDCGRDSWL